MNPTWHCLAIPFWMAACLYLATVFWGVAGSLPGNVFGWGEVLSGTNYVHVVVPLGLTNVVALDSRGVNTLALRADGSVFAFGETKYDLTNVPPAARSQVMAVAAGWYHSVALKSNGTLVVWGDSASGKTTLPASAQSGVVGIAAGANHSLAVKSDGSVVAWGFNTYGQVKVPTGLSNVIAVAAGATHSLALKADGTVVGWGQNNLDQIRVPGSCTNVVAIAAGDFHSLALRADGTVVAWGSNTDAKGIYTGQSRVPKDLTNVISMVAGAYHSLALRADGIVIGWGGDVHGQAETPQQIKVSAITAGSAFSLGVTPLPLPRLLPPESLQTVGATNVTLAISIESGAPFTCQWSFNGQLLPNATDLSLTIHNFNLANAGAYSVIVSNRYGTAKALSVVRLANSPIVLIDGVDVGGGVAERVSSSQISMSSALGTNAVIHYTLDGSVPDFTDPLYEAPFRLTNSAVVRAISYTVDYASFVEAAPLEVRIQPLYSLEAGTPGGGTVFASPVAYSDNNRYVSNTLVTLTATPATGWFFTSWTGDIQDTNSTIAVRMDRPRKVQAVFSRNLSPVINGNGSVQIIPASGPYPFGATVQVTALPSDGSYFFGWAGAASGFVNPLSLTLTNAAALTALFGVLETNQVSLTILLEGNGSVTNSPSKKFYTNGEPVVLTALPSTNSLFAGWTGGASGDSNPLTVTLVGNTVIKASFVIGIANHHPAISEAPKSCTVSPGGSTLLTVGASGDGPFSYQWRFGGAPLAGATNPTLKLVNLTQADAGLYDVVITGASGAVTSPAASVSLFHVELASSAAGNVPVLTLDGAVGTSYRLEYSSTPGAPADWTLLLPATLQSRTFLYTDEPLSPNALRFYRAVPQ